MTRIKICGITNPDDAVCAVSCGVDYLGFIFAPSKRKIIKETAVHIRERIPSFSAVVGVFLNGKKKEIESICSFAGIKIIQLHGEETPSFCNYFLNRDYQVIKVIRVKDRDSLELMKTYPKVTTFLLDTYSENAQGGTGMPFDWEILVENKLLEDKNIFISGGISNENVGEIINRFNPYAVDVSSSLEEYPGKKSHSKIEQFVRVVREGKVHG